jgi:hypothetical protein
MNKYFVVVLVLVRSCVLVKISGPGYAEKISFSVDYCFLVLNAVVGASSGRA